MKFLCGSCRTKYQISDEKVRGKILTIRCKKCGAKIIVRESLVRDGGEGTVVAPVAEEPRSTPFNPRIASGGSGALSQAFSQALESGTQDVPIESERPPTAFEWFTAVDGQQQGPFDFEHVANSVRSGALQGRHYVWHEGMEHWRRIRDVEQLRRLAESNTSPPPPPPADRGLELDKTTAEPEVAPMAGIASSELPTTATSSTLFGDGTAASSGKDPLAAGQAPFASGQEIEDLTDGEDLFANVPRASAAELVQKESTRFFVNAAGVRGIKNLNRLGLVLGGALILLLGGLVAGAATGVVKINIPGFGNPFADDGEGIAMMSGESDDPNSLRFLGEERKPPKPVQPARAGGRAARNPPPSSSDDGFEFGGDYIRDEATTGGPRGSRGPSGASFEIGDVRTGGGVEASSVGDSELPSSGGPEVPLVATRTLSDEAIRRTVDARKQSVKICYEQSLRGQQSLSGKLEIRVRVEPSGQVSKTSIDTAQFRSSRIGKCIADKIRNWRFPPFEGEAEEVVVPFLLARGSY